MKNPRVRLPPALAEVARSLLRLDRSKVDTWTGARAAIGIAVVLAAGRMSGHTVAAVTATVGALSAGFASLQGAYRRKIEVTMAAACAMGACAFLGDVAGHDLPLFVAVTAAVGFVAGMMVSLGQAALVVGIQGVVGLVVFSQFSYPATVAARDAGLVVLGGAVQALVVMLAWPLRPFQYERRALAAAYRALADYARSAPAGPGAADRFRGHEQDLPPPEPFDALAEVVADPQPFGRSRRDEYRRLAQDAERIRLELIGRPAGRNEATAAALERRAATIAAGHLPGSGSEPDDGNKRLIHRPERLPSLSWWGETAATLRANLSGDSQTFRHAVRLAATLAAADVISKMLPFAHHYWMPMTAMLVLRPDFSTTVTRGLSRVGGTLIGAGLVTLFLAETRPASDWLALLVIALAFTAVSVVMANYATFSLLIASLVVTLLAFTGAPEVATAGDRAVYTAVGAGLAMAAYVLWPTWEAGYLAGNLQRLAVAQEQWAAAVIAGGDAEPARRAARLARSNAEAALGRSAAEPLTARRRSFIGPEDAARFVADCRACARVISSLQLAVGSGCDPGSGPVKALAQVLTEVTKTLKAGSLPGQDRLAEMASALEEVEEDAADPVVTGLVRPGG